MRLIDADALLKDGIKVNFGFNNDGIIMIPMRDVTKSIKDAPTIEAVPVVHGELVYTNDDVPPHCSICDTIIHADSKYCRECGARMEKECYETM